MHLCCSSNKTEADYYLEGETQKRRSTGREAMLAAAVRATIARLRFSHCFTISSILLKTKDFQTKNSERINTISMFGKRSNHNK